MARGSYLPNPRNQENKQMKDRLNLLLNSPCYNLIIMVNSSDRWTPFFSVPRWYDAVASHCHLFSRDHDHVAETSRADHYRAPRRNRRIAPLAPTSDGWDDHCVPLSYKKVNPPAVLLLPRLAKFRARQCRRSCFPLWIVLANPPLARPRCCFAHSPGKLFSHLRRPPPEGVRRRPREEPRLHRRPCLSSWRCSSPSVGRLQRCTSASSVEFVFF
jgi:hypothetical protein